MEYKLIAHEASCATTRASVEDRDDALRLAQALANAEGISVRVIGPGLAVDIEGDELAYPELTFAERCQIVTLPVLNEMREDALERQERAQDEFLTIVEELGRRADR